MPVFYHFRIIAPSTGLNVLGPIFYRELQTVPRRRGQFAGRVAILALLTILGITTWQATIGFDRDATLGETARFGELLFRISVFVELTLLVFFSTISASSAVSQEKDRRTFILLLITDMRDYEIVLGKLVGSLLPITIVLGVSVPLLSIYLLMGGIAPTQVVQAGLILLASSFAAGSLGGLVALWRERTFQALALSVLFLMLFLGLTQALAVVGASIMPAWDWPTIQAWLDPIRAMAAVLDPFADHGGFLHPAYGFTLTMFGFCALLNLIGIWKLRRWNPSGEERMQREGPDHDPEANLTDEQLKTFRAKAHAAPGREREVWANPILWREIRTLAYGRRPLLVKFAFGIVLALILYYALSRPLGAQRGEFTAAYGLIPLCVVSLLLVTAQAVTSITSERDGGALDVLLATDVSPREFVFGKLLGSIYNTKEYLIPSLALALYYGISGLLTRVPDDWSTFDRFTANIAPTLAIIGVQIVMFLFVLSLGLHVALRIVNSRLAIINTLGTVFFLNVGTLIAIYLIVINGGSFANQWLSFISFLILGIGGLWWVLSTNRPSPALTVAAVACPLATFYGITNLLIAKPGTTESADPLVPFVVVAGAFGFTIFAMLFPLVTEFDVALGRTTSANES